jgi:hypothetical protein
MGISLGPRSRNPGLETNPVEASVLRLKLDEEAWPVIAAHLYTENLRWVKPPMLLISDIFEAASEREEAHVPRVVAAVTARIPAGGVAHVDGVGQISAVPYRKPVPQFFAESRDLPVRLPTVKVGESEEEAHKRS